MKKIAILGSTGSIGTQSLEVIAASEDMQVTALAAAGNQLDLLEQQVRSFRPALVGVYLVNKAQEMEARLSDLISSGTCRVVAGMDGLLEIAVQEACDTVITAFVGMMGIRPTVAAIKAGKNIALANKETLVTAGHLIMPMAKECGVSILPVDSEHSAIFQCLQGNQGNKIDKILLTASGGPFRNYTKEQMAQITLEDALKHPNWSMGKKITIDSSTMANKGLEVMEAKWLFGVDYDQIQVVIQPQSIIHSMVQFEDGAVMAQLGTPDMKLPIQYALTYPARLPMKGPRLDFTTMTQISIAAPDMERFPALALAYVAGRKGGNMPTIFNAANERAVQLFLERRIGYHDIAKTIEWAMDTVTFEANATLDTIFETEQEVYDRIERRM